MPSDRRHSRLGSRRAHKLTEWSLNSNWGSPALLLLSFFFFSLLACLVVVARLYECIFFSSTSHLIVFFSSRWTVFSFSSSKFWIKFSTNIHTRFADGENISGKSSPKRSIYRTKIIAESQFPFVVPSLSRRYRIHPFRKLFYLSNINVWDNRSLPHRSCFGFRLFSLTSIENAWFMNCPDPDHHIWSPQHNRSSHFAAQYAS